jgi:hypothetical protein
MKGKETERDQDFLSFRRDAGVAKVERSVIVNGTFQGFDSVILIDPGSDVIPTLLWFCFVG